MQNYIKIPILFIALLCSVTDVFAQKTIRSDSLLALIRESGSVFAANFDWKELDYEDCERNPNLKPHLLKLIDRSECFIDMTNRYIEQNKETYIRKWFDKQSQHFADSVKSSPTLLKYYTDSIVEVIRRERNKGEKLTNKLFPEQDCLDGRSKVFKQIKWPEAYALLRKQWDDGYRCSDIFNLLLEYQDPDAWKIYLEEKISGEMTEVGGKTYAQLTRDGIHYIYYNWISHENLCSYDVDMFISLLGKRNAYARISCYEDIGMNKDTLVPLNVGLIHSTKIGLRLLKSEQPIVKEIVNSLYTPEAKEELLTKKFHGKEEYFAFHKNSPLFSMAETEMEQISKKIADNKEAFRKALAPLVNEIEKRDSKWKNAMPYAKKKSAAPQIQPQVKKPIRKGQQTRKKR